MLLDVEKKAEEEEVEEQELAEAKLDPTLLNGAAWNKSNV